MKNEIYTDNSWILVIVQQKWTINEKPIITLPHALPHMDFKPPTQKNISISQIEISDTYYKIVIPETYYRSQNLIYEVQPSLFFTSDLQNTCTYISQEKSSMHIKRGRRKADVYDPASAGSLQ